MNTNNNRMQIIKNLIIRFLFAYLEFFVANYLPENRKQIEKIKKGII
jgi:hypothetical protein